MYSVLVIADFLLAGIAFLWLGVATIQDIRKREVYNWLNFSLVIIALAVRAGAAVLSLSPGYILWGIAGFGIAFALANIFYYGRIFAGGDAKLLIAMGTVFATNPLFLQTQFFSGFEIPFFATFVVNMLFAGSAYGICYSIALAFRNWKEFNVRYIEMKKKHKKILVGCLAAAAAMAGIFFLTKERGFILSCIAFCAFPYFLMFVRAVERAGLIQTVPARKLTEGDWLFKEVRAGKARIKPSWEGLTKEDITKIQRAGIKSVVVKAGIPFVPVFLIALIVSMSSAGNLLLYLTRLIQ